MGASGSYYGHEIERAKKLGRDFAQPKNPDPTESLKLAESPEIRDLRAELERVTRERDAIKTELQIAKAEFHDAVDGATEARTMELQTSYDTLRARLEALVEKVEQYEECETLECYCEPENNYICDDCGARDEMHIALAAAKDALK